MDNMLVFTTAMSANESYRTVWFHRPRETCLYLNYNKDDMTAQAVGYSRRNALPSGRETTISNT